MTIDTAELEQAIQNDEGFTKTFKHKLTSADKLGSGSWAWNDERKAFVLETPNGSTMRLRFFDTVKPIFDYMNVEVPGKESFLSYIEVVVYPLGKKAYMFKSDLRQVVWGVSKKAAQVKHDHGLYLLGLKAKALGFELTAESWAHNYDRTDY
jgi:hypothetical protein